MSWPAANLGELTNILSGFAFKSSRFGTTGDLPIVRIRDVVSARSSTYYSGDYDEKFLVENGDLLIGMDGEFNRQYWSGGTALLNQRVCKITPVNDHLDTGYLYYWLPKALKDIEDRTPFVTVKHLSAKTLKEQEIPLPPLEEQRRIAGILDAADAMRRRRREALALLDTLPGAIFAEMFGAEMEGFENVALGGHEQFLTSGSRGWAKYYAPAGRPFIRIGNVAGGLVSTQDLVYVQPPNSAEARRTLVERNDILISITADLGRIGVVPEELGGNAHINQHLALFRHDGLFDSDFLAAALSHPRTQAQFTKLNRNGVKAGLNFDDIRSVKVPLPPYEIQIEFSRRLEKARAHHSTLQKTLPEMNSLFASLQSRAFAGEL